MVQEIEESSYCIGRYSLCNAVSNGLPGKLCCNTVVPGRFVRCIAIAWNISGEWGRVHNSKKRNNMILITGAIELFVIIAFILVFFEVLVGILQFIGLMITFFIYLPFMCICFCSVKKAWLKTLKNADLI